MPDYVWQLQYVMDRSRADCGKIVNIFPSDYSGWGYLDMTLPLGVEFIYLGDVEVEEILDNRYILNPDTFVLEALPESEWNSVKYPQPDESGEQEGGEQ